MTYFKRISAFLLFLVLLVNVLAHFVIVADYYAFTSSFEKKCVNKAKPQLQCHGKCQMNDLLKKAEKQKETNSKENIDFQDLYADPGFSLQITSPLVYIESIPLRLKIGFSKDRSISIFHPPC